VRFEDSAAWESWLDDNYQLQSGVWIKMPRKGSGIPSVSLTETLDGALCYGWIDGQRRSWDETYFLQKYTPRRARSTWSRVNIAKVEALIAAGRLRPSGHAAIEAAKADGRWDAAYESQKNATIPPDLAAELERNQPAKAFFDSLNRAGQYAFFFRLMTAKTPAARADRLQKMVAMLQAGEHFH
jgi:uncharacterized protein YdeI (YjbR/CyaY-like superfamily)